MPATHTSSSSWTEKFPAMCSDVVIDYKHLCLGRYLTFARTASVEQVTVIMLTSRSDSSSSSTLNLITSTSDEVRPKDSDSTNPEKKELGDEGWLVTLIQVIGPFLVAGIGSMCTGILLDTVKEWNNFKMIECLITLVPTLLGLKGNLEMTVTARLCTESNLGKLDDPKVLRDFLRDDLLLTQFQATIVSLLASVLSLGIQAIKNPSTLSLVNVVVVCSSAVVTASLACLFLGLLMTGVVVASRKLGINPDNVAAPLASSLGDISTLALFAYISAGMFALKDHLYVPFGLMLIFVVLCPIWGYLGIRSKSVRQHLEHGWLPIMVAMCISLGAGYILDISAEEFPMAPAYVPAVTGICGNLLVILICRMTTYLRNESKLGDDNGTVQAIRSSNPLRRSKHKFASLNATFQVLLVLPLVAHIIFLPIISYFTEEVNMTVVYTAVFLSAVFAHASIMLFATRDVVLRLWRWGIDPDVAAIPILTAVADLTGGAFTCAIFLILYRLHDPSIVLTQS